MGNSNFESQAEAGCLKIIGIIVLIQVVQQALIELLPVLVKFGAIGLGGYVLFQFFTQLFNSGVITDYVKKKMDENSKETIYLDANGKIIGLPEPKEDLAQQIKDLKDQLDVIETENEQKVKEALKKYATQIDEKNKQSILEEVFGYETVEYARSDEYERQQEIKARQKREEIVSIRELRQDLIEKLFNYKFEAQEDRSKIRAEMREGFNYLEKEITSLKGFCVEKFAYMDARITTEIAGIKELVSNLRVEVTREFADLKVQIGREIVRLDSAMLQVVGKLEKYNTRVEKFSYEVKQVKLDADRSQMRAERMLTQAQSTYAHHQADLKVLSKDIDMSLGKMALHSESFANTVGAAKLKLDKVSQDQYLTLKDIAHAQKDLAHGQIGTNLLRQQYQQETANAQLKMQNLIGEKRRVEERIQHRIAREQSVGDLRHRLYMTEENLRHASNRASLMQKEFSIIQRLSK